MYKSFKIKNFRCFPKISIDDLSRINLIVGPNNVGKTTLLEALYIHIGPMNQTLATTLDRKRGVPIAPANAAGLWGSLFYKFNLDSSVELTGKDIDGTQRTIRLKVAHPLITMQALAKDTEIMAKPSSATDIQIGEDLIFEYDDGHKKTLRKMSVTLDGIKVDPPPSENPFPGFYITCRQFHNPAEYAERYGNLQVNKQEQAVVDTIKVIEPRLKSLTNIPIANISIIHADLGGDRLLPLPLAGEGMVRLASIAIDLASAPSGVVLIDEVDTGLHYSVMSQVWKAIAITASKLNVQVFATTHSAECVRSAHEAFKGLNKYEAKLYRIERSDDTFRAITYDRDTLEAAIDTGLEFR
jgi:GTPase SAR1 family protein